MKIRILVLNVSDADAIIVSLLKGDTSLVILIDGGRYSNSTQVIPVLDKILSEHGKQAPDLVIGTHFDNDHIAGLEPLITKYGNKIPLLWMFNTSKLDLLISRPAPSFIDEEIFPTEKDDVIGGKVNKEEHLIEEFLIRSVQKEKDILQLANDLKIPTIEPIAGKCILPGWEEVSILGPTQAYYDKLFPEHLDRQVYIKEAIKSNKEDDYTDDCSQFNKQSSAITRVNLNSCIIQIDIKGNKFLFSADAGIDSFYAIPKYQQVLKDLLWLKMPHHGSANNINNTLLEIMNPKEVAVSGNKYISNELISCMQSKRINVKTTRDDGSIEYNYEF